MPRRVISAPTAGRASLLAGELDRSRCRRRDADQRLEQGRLAGAVAAEQRHDLVLAQRRTRRSLQDMALAVERVDVLDGEQRRRACAADARRRGDSARRARADVDLLHLGVRCARHRPLPSTSTSPSFMTVTSVGDLEHAVDVVLDEQHRQCPPRAT